MRGFADITQTIRDIADRPLLISMILLAGAMSFFIGNSYQAQMPSFALDLGHGNPGISYSMLLAVDAAGALVAGFLLESSGWLRPNSRTALILALLWCVALASFALAGNYLLALLLLFIAGFFELSFSSMAQTLVQVNAPIGIRRRVIGLFTMSAQGMRTFSGITVGLVGTAIGVHYSLALSALALFVFITWLFFRISRSSLNAFHNT